MSNYSDFGIELPYGAKGEIDVLCPQCSHTRKREHLNEKCLSVNVAEGVWVCHHCGWRGNLVCKAESGCRVAAKAKPLFAAIKYAPDDSLPGELIDWFAGRGISAATLLANKISLRQRSICLPYYKFTKVVNIKYRSIEKKAFHQTPKGEPCLYRFDRLTGGTLIITEGELDALSFYEAGYHNVTSIPNGAPPANAENLDRWFFFLESAGPLLARCEKIVLATDSDEPGKVARRELVRRLGVEKCSTVVYPDGCKDANDVLVKYGKVAVTSLVECARPVPIEGASGPFDLGEADGIFENGVKRGISTGWRTMDRLYTVQPGEFTVITGIPGHGKSEWVEALMCNLVLNHGWKFAIFSPENLPLEQHLVKIAEKITGQPARGDYAGIKRMDSETWQCAKEYLQDHLRFIYPRDEELSIDKILEVSRQVLCQFGLNGLILDPWNEFEHRYRNMNEAQYLNQELAKIRRFARLNNLCVWLVAHPRVMHAVKDKHDVYNPPTMYDISGGAHWYNKADNGITVFRENFDIHQAQIIVNKVRHKHIGKKGTVNLKYSYATGRYFDMPQDDKGRFNAHG